MAKLIVWNIASVDGYFEGAEPWDLSMHETIWGPELEALSNEQLGNAEALIFGRKTYVGMAVHWTTAQDEPGQVTHAMNALPKIVVSNTLTSADWNNTTIMSGDIAGQIRERKAKADKPLYVFGSAELVSSLLEDGLVDEYRLGIAPVVLGKGNPLFKQNGSRLPMDLIKSQPLENGGIILYYAVGTAD